MRQTLRAQEWVDSHRVAESEIRSGARLWAAVMAARARAEQYATGLPRVGEPRLLIAWEIDVEVPDGPEPADMG
jgi:hypothetical protein